MNNDGSDNPETAGEIYTRLENDGTAHNPVDVQLVEYIHPFPNYIQFSSWLTGAQDDLGLRQWLYVASEVDLL